MSPGQPQTKKSIRAGAKHALAPYENYNVPSDLGFNFFEISVKFVVLTKGCFAIYLFPK